MYTFIFKNVLTLSPDTPGPQIVGAVRIGAWRLDILGNPFFCQLAVLLWHHECSLILTIPGWRLTSASALLTALDDRIQSQLDYCPLLWEYSRLPRVPPSVFHPFFLAYFRISLIINFTVASAWPLLWGYPGVDSLMSTRITILNVLRAYSHITPPPLFPIVPVVDCFGSLLQSSCAISHLTSSNLERRRSKATAHPTFF